jgi:tRNA (guanine-N7-)-methyltransferase
MNMTTNKRTIRSYVLRQGRMTDSQVRAMDDLWPIYGIDFKEQALDLDSLFGRCAPRILDIGSGMGETLIQLATNHPENDYLSVEVHRPGIGKLLGNADKQCLSNIRIFNRDVMEVLKHQLPNHSLDEVYILFPDPWPKKRHHKRRMVNPEFLYLLVLKLKAHARLFLATDWEDLAEHMREVCDAYNGLINLAGTGNYAPRAKWRPITKFENRGIKLGHQVWDLCYGIK